MAGGEGHVNGRILWSRSIDAKPYQQNSAKEFGEDYRISGVKKCVPVCVIIGVTSTPTVNPGAAMTDNTNGNIIPQNRQANISVLNIFVFVTIFRKKSLEKDS